MGGALERPKSRRASASGPLGGAGALWYSDGAAPGPGARCRLAIGLSKEHRVERTPTATRTTDRY